MAISFLSNESGSRKSSPGGALATLLGVYTALYLGVLGAIHFATSPDAAAAVPEVTTLHIAVTTLPAEPFGEVGGVSANELIEPETPDNSRECTEAIDTLCTYN